MNGTFASSALAVALVVTASGACTKKNPSYCDTAMDCPNGLHCDTARHECVADETDAGTTMSCGDNSGCSSTTPVCDDGSCRACALDDECTSGVCRPDGSCESPDNVLYAAPNGASAGACTPSSPCDLMYARGQVDAQKYTIRAANGTYSLPSAFIVSPPIAKVAIIGGRSAVFERATTGPSFDVRSGSQLILRGITLHRGLLCDTGTLDIKGAAFSSAGNENRSWLHLSNCISTVTASELEGSTALGIDSANGGALTVVATTVQQSAGDAIRMQYGQLLIERSTIAQNMGIGVSSTAEQTTVRRSTIYANRMGGISSMGGVFDITNNFVYRNGNAANALFGGMRLDTNLTGNRVEHNTVTRNDAQYGAAPVLAGGVFCKGGGTSSNNLVTNNFYGNEFDANAQTSGTCTFSGSQVTASDTNVHFVRPVAEPFDYHLADAQSSAANAGVVSNPQITEDFDGDPRGSMPDVGADELQ